MSAAQAAAAVDEQPEPLRGLERIGETPEWGSLMLRLVALAGWKVEQRPRLGGGVIVIASRAGCVIERAGEDLAEVATPIFEEAMQHRALSVVR